MPLARTAAAVSVSGALLGLTLPPLGLWPLAWVGLSPLLVAARKAHAPGRAFLLGWLAGASFFAVTMNWIYSTCRFAGVPFPVAVLAWAALAGFLGLNWGIFAALARASAAKLPEPAWPWACAALWAAIEFLSARFTLRVGGDVLGYTQWRLLPMLQPSSWLGPHALGFVIVLANAALASWMVERRCAKPVPWNVRVAAALAALWLAAGAGSLLAAPKPTGLMRRVAVLQPNIDQYRKWDESEAGAIRATLDRLLAEASRERPALVVWPETSVPGWLEGENLAWTAGWAKKSGAYHLVGGLVEDAGKSHSSAVLIDPSGRVAGRYDKRQLVPFGEFVPFREWLEPWIGILAQMGDFDAGAPMQPALATPVGPLGVTICYEAVFPRWSRAAALAGARVLVNITNDGWYKDTWGPLHHFHTNRFRAVETRMPVVRSGNTGISAVIDPWGRVTAKLDLLKEGVLLGELPGDDPFPRGSLYSRTGDWLGWLAVLGAAAALAAAWRRRRS